MLYKIPAIAPVKRPLCLIARAADAPAIITLITEVKITIGETRFSDSGVYVSNSAARANTKAVNKKLLTIAFEKAIEYVFTAPVSLTVLYSS